MLKGRNDKGASKDTPCVTKGSRQCNTERKERMEKITEYMENRLSGMIYCYPYVDKDGNFHKKDVDTKDDTLYDRNDRENYLQLAADDLIMIASHSTDLTDSEPIMQEIARFVASIRADEGRLFSETHERLKNTLLHCFTHENEVALRLVAQVLFRQTQRLFKAGNIPEYMRDIDYYKNELLRMHLFCKEYRLGELYTHTIETAFFKETKFDYMKKHVREYQFRSFSYLGEEESITESYITIPHYFMSQLLTVKEQNVKMLYEDRFSYFRNERDSIDRFNRYLGSCAIEERRSRFLTNEDYQNEISTQRGMDGTAFFPALAYAYAYFAEDAQKASEILKEYPEIYHLDSEVKDVKMEGIIEKVEKNITEKIRSVNMKHFLEALRIWLPLIIAAPIFVYVLRQDLKRGNFIGTLFLMLAIGFIASIPDILHPTTRKKTVIEHYDIFGRPTGKSVIYEPESNSKKNRK